MEIITCLRKIMDKQFQPLLQKVMEKWTEALDVHAFVKIAQIIESETKAFLETVKHLTQFHGYEINGEKSVSAEEISQYLLEKFGKYSENGNFSMAGVSDAEVMEFKKEKDNASNCLRIFQKEYDALLDSKITLKIPRLIKVTDKFIRKEIINSHTCFVLEPILDLTGVSDLPKEEVEKEED